MGCSGGDCQSVMFSRLVAIFAGGGLIVGLLWGGCFILDKCIKKEFRFQTVSGEIILKKGMTKSEVEQIIKKDLFLISTLLKGWKQGVFELEKDSYSINFKDGKLVDIKFFKHADEDE